MAQVEKKATGSIVAVLFKAGYVVNDMLDPDTHEEIRTTLSRHEYKQAVDWAEKELHVRFITDPSDGLQRAIKRPSRK